MVVSLLSGWFFVLFFYLTSKNDKMQALNEATIIPHICWTNKN